MKKEMLEHAARALRSFGATPRHAQLARVPSATVSEAQAADALQALATQASADTPVTGWWQHPDRLANTAQNAPLPDAAAMETLLEGEWTVGHSTLQLRRIGSSLRLNRLLETTDTAEAPAGADVQPTLVHVHELIGRADLNAPTLSVAVYSLWDPERQQVVPIAQRLLTLGQA